MLQMLYVRASEQKRFLDIRRFINNNNYYYYKQLVYTLASVYEMVSSPAFIISMYIRSFAFTVPYLIPL